MPDEDLLNARMSALMLDYDPLKQDTLIKDDPFQGAYTQANRMRAFCEITIDGVNITDKIEPHLISVRIVDGDQLQCEIELDDRDALLPIPPLLASVQVALGWQRESMVKTFDGVIIDLEHGFGRKQGGRRMWVHAQGWDMLGTRIKEPMQTNLGEGAPPGQKEGQKHGLPDWIQKLVTAGGGKADVAGHFAQNMQDYWGAMGASPLHEITSLGEKFGAMVKWDFGNTLRFEKPGQRGISCRAVWRDNLISWRVRPFAARSSYKGMFSQNFDAAKGIWQQKNMEFGSKGRAGTSGQAAAGQGGPAPEATSSGGEQANAGGAEKMDSSYLGVGRIVINGEPLARWNSYVMLQGARPGVDGKYLIHVAEHAYSRGGYVTTLDVVPYGKALGADSVLGNWPLPRPNPNIGR